MFVFYNTGTENKTAKRRFGKKRFYHNAFGFTEETGFTTEFPRFSGD